jgi:transcriptional regulator NrdR family protein
MVITDRIDKLQLLGNEDQLAKFKDEDGVLRESAEVEFVTRNLPSILKSNGKIEKFDPERIIISLLNETSITEEKAKEVTWEIMIKLLNSDQGTVTAPFLREQICSILFNKNPKWRFEYTRLGMPFRDFEKICNGYFDQYRSGAEIDGSIDQIVSVLDKKTLGEMVRHMVKDYVGVRNHIYYSEDPSS